VAALMLTHVVIAAVTMSLHRCLAHHTLDRQNCLRATVSAGAFFNR
jgi:fatty-acid desaturase